MPELTTTIGGNCPDEAKGMRIVQVADSTGDVVREALIEYCHMGAYTSDLALMQIENGKPVEPDFEAKKARLVP